MRWFPFFILAYLTLGLQAGLGGLLRFGGGHINLMLLAVVFVSVHAPRQQALLGCFLLGAMQDLITQEPMGLYALAYGLLAMVVIKTQDWIHQEHPLTRFSLSFLGGLVVTALVWLHGWIAHSSGPAIRPRSGPLLLTALYTALASLPALALLQRIKPTFGFQPVRRQMR